MICNLLRKLKTRKWQLGIELQEKCTARIHALEGGIYLVEVITDSESAYVKNRLSGAAQHFYALDIAKQCARDLGIINIEMALDTPYDQMIGLKSLP